MNLLVWQLGEPSIDPWKTLVQAKSITAASRHFSRPALGKIVLSMSNWSEAKFLEPRLKAWALAYCGGVREHPVPSGGCKTENFGRRRQAGTSVNFGRLTFPPTLLCISFSWTPNAGPPFLWAIWWLTERKVVGNRASFRGSLFPISTTYDCLCPQIQSAGNRKFHIQHYDVMKSSAFRG